MKIWPVFYPVGHFSDSQNSKRKKSYGQQKNFPSKIKKSKKGKKNSVAHPWHWCATEFQTDDFFLQNQKNSKIQKKIKKKEKNSKKSYNKEDC